MSWGLLLGLALVVFFNRYFFLEPRIHLKLPHFLRQMLQYSAPCLLTAICAPIVFFQEDGAFREIPLNPYFMGAVLTIIFAIIFKKILVSLAVSLLCFYLMQYVFLK